MTPAVRRRYAAPSRFVARRIAAAEHLDDPTIPPDDRAASYRDLERFERWPWQFGPLLDGVLRVLGPAPPARVTLLELGAGTGHTGRRLAAALGQRGIAVHLHLTDRDPEFLSEGPGVSVSRLDWLFDPVPAADVVVANLVLHHFGTMAAVRALRKAYEAARLGGVVYDLDRSALVFHALRLALPFVVESPVTEADALISVQQAFTTEELRAMAEEAGLPGARVTRHGLGRNRLVWRRPPARPT